MTEPSHTSGPLPKACAKARISIGGEILDPAALPLRMVGHTPCLPSEDGSAVRDTRGMIRMHQFSKVELVSITTPDQSAAEHERMTDAAQEILLPGGADIEAIEPDHPRYPMAQVQPYGIAMVQAPQVWPTTTGGNGIDVCVIDSGIHAAHEDFAGLSLSGDASPGQSWNTDTCGHGSHVSGTIAARTEGLICMGNLALRGTPPRFAARRRGERGRSVRVCRRAAWR